MKKNLFLLTLLLLTTSIFIYSCRKDIGLFDDQQSASTNTDDLESSKIYHAKFATLNASTYSALFKPEDKAALAQGSNPVKHSFIKLAPIWKKSFTLKATAGTSLIVVPTIENKLSGNEFEVRRFFIFSKQGASITDGKIVEVLGFHYALEGKINEILAGYTSNSLADLNGAIFEYDLNYFRIKGEVIKQGKRTGITANLYNLPTAKKSIDGKVTNGYYDTGNPGYNGCQTLWYCDGNGMGITCYNQGYVEGSCYPPTGNPNGSSSGYDSSSNYGGGGGSYSGNTPPASTWSGVAIIVNPSTRDCVGSIKGQLSGVASLISGLKSVFGNETGTAGVSDMISRLSNSTDWNVSIGETDIPPVEDPITGTITQANAQTTPHNGTININFNKAFLNGATDLAVARTMIHELMHSYFSYGLAKTTDPGYAQFVVANDLLFKKNGSEQSDQNSAQHTLIANKYVDQMASMLKTYAESRGITSPDPNVSLLEYCKDLSWSGLADTKAYRSAPNKSRITNHMQAENTNSQNSTHTKGC